MENNSKVIGTIELRPHQEQLVEQFAAVILKGTLEQAEYTFKVIFEREPSELDMQLLKALCEMKMAEAEKGKPSIYGVFNGGKKHLH